MPDQPTIVFDLDGTLADSIPDIVGALNRTLEKMQLAPTTPTKVAHLTANGGLRAMIAQACAESCLSFAQQDLDDAFNATVKDYDQNIAVDTALYPGVTASLEVFRSNGWLLAICTNKPVAQATKLLGALNIEHQFSAITGFDSFAFKKPDPRHLTRTIELAGGRTDRAIMVGDTKTDVLTAQNAGIPVVAVDFGYSDLDVRTLAPSGVISGFDALFAQAAKLVR